jgi:hypothetical protein
MQLVGAIGFAQCVALIAALRAGHIQRRSGAPVPLSVAPSKDLYIIDPHDAPMQILISIL